uniref:Uncharacterized protein n=1 Tax=Anguilla anguilla TaxID=7936 RepID=A0A0E9SII2_ANGAN
MHSICFDLCVIVVLWPIKPGTSKSYCTR